MRINRYIAQTTGMSRRAADLVIAEGRVSVNSQPPSSGQDIKPDDTVTLDNKPLTPPVAMQTILLNKPTGYVVSREGQGSRTVYDLLPTTLHHLKPVGRLDKDSSGLLLLTNDGQLAQRLTHPSFVKEKLYEINLNKPLTDTDASAIQRGVELEDGRSQLRLTALAPDRTRWRVAMHEGRNRQIRRTFQALGYTVTKLHRFGFGDYTLPAELEPGSWQQLSG